MKEPDVLPKLTCLFEKEIVHDTTEVSVFFFIYFATVLINPLTAMSDQDRISPYNINTISSRQVMRIKKNIN